MIPRKKAKAQRQKRLKFIQRSYPRYPFGVLERNWEVQIEQYLETGDKSVLPYHVQNPTSASGLG